MSNPSVVTLALPAAVANGIAQSQAVAGAGNLTLNGSLVSSGVANLVIAQRVGIASSGNDATVVFTVNGTDRYGNKQSIAVTGVNTDTVNTALDFLTVTSIHSSAATVGSITVGTVGVGSTDWLSDNFLAPDWSLSIRTNGPTGTNYSVETTFDDPNANPNLSAYNISLNPGSQWPPVVTVDTTINNVSGAKATQYGPGNMIFAHRLTLNSGTGAVTMWSIQAGIGSPLPTI